MDGLGVSKDAGDKVVGVNVGGGADGTGVAGCSVEGVGEETRAVGTVVGNQVLLEFSPKVRGAKVLFISFLVGR